MSDDSDDDEMLREYLPIFASLRRRALPSSCNTSPTQASTSKVANSYEAYADTSGEEWMQRAFANDFTNFDESTTSSTASPKGVTNVFVKKPSNGVNIIETSIDEGQTNIETGLDVVEIGDCNEDDATETDKNQNAIKEIVKRKIPSAENKPSRSNKLSKLSKIMYFPDYSYLHRIETLVKRCVSDQIPELMINDILIAKNYIILEKVRSDYLFETGGLVFNQIKCRGTVVGVSLGNTFQFVVSDGTGSVCCILDENIANAKDNSPCINNFDTNRVTYETITTAYDVERGQIVQVMGYLEEHYNKIRVVAQKLCKEDPVDLRREVEYLNHLSKLETTFISWKQKVENILRY